MNTRFETLCLVQITFMVSLWMSCSTSKGYVDANHLASVESHRSKTEEGLILGDRAPLAKEDLADLRYFEINHQFIVKAKVDFVEVKEPFELPTYSGITKTFIKYATLSFELLGQPKELSIYRNLETIRMPQYKNYLFLPFKDETTSDTTYGGGRYINLSTLDIVNGTVELDFNKSYNPWCAYSDGFNCPIPPAENTLDIAVLAGEKNYAGVRK